MADDALMMQSHAQMQQWLRSTPPPPAKALESPAAKEGYTLLQTAVAMTEAALPRPIDGRLGVQPVVWPTGEIAATAPWVDVCAFIDDHCLTRYLVAHRGSAESAFKAMMETVQWRVRTLPSSFLPSPPYPSSQADLETLYGRSMATRFLEWSPVLDLHGRPCLWITGRYADLSIPPAQRLAFVVASMEDGVRRIGESDRALAMATGGTRRVTQWNVFIDETAKEWKHVDNSFLKQVTPVVFAHYVERLHKCVVINGGMLTSAAITIAKMFIDARTSSKLLQVRLKPTAGITAFATQSPTTAEFDAAGGSPTSTASPSECSDASSSADGGGGSVDPATGAAPESPSSPSRGPTSGTTTMDPTLLTFCGKSSIPQYLGGDLQFPSDWRQYLATFHPR